MASVERLWTHHLALRLIQLKKAKRPLPLTLFRKITDIDVTYYVNSNALNVRAGNFASTTSLGQLSYGDAVKVTGYTDNN